MALGQSNPMLVATPSVTMNYTVVINQLDTSAGTSRVTLSATSRVPGVTPTVSPRELTLLGPQGAVLLGITVAPNVNSSTLSVEIMASTASGSTSLTLDFKLNKALIVLPNVVLKPPTLHVKVGQTVTWLDLVQIDDDGLGFANITLGDRSAASPTLVQFDTWSHKFDKPGTYPYDVVVYQIPLAGVVVVE
jgi:plastocyanin